MIDFSQLRDTTLRTLNGLFAKTEIELVLTPYSGTISSFFIKVQTADQLGDQWEKISNAIAIYYQTKLATEFERWNLYLFYLVPVDVERSLKYQIENDPISSRKIVIDLYQNTSFSEIISEHITNTNLNLNVSPPANQDNGRKIFLKNDVFSAAIHNFTTVKKNKTAELDIPSILNEIENRLK